MLSPEMIKLLTITFQATVATVIVILIGAFMRRMKWITREADKPLTDMTMNVLYPAATFMSIRGNENLQSPMFILFVVFVGWLTIAVGMVVARVYIRFCSPLTGMNTDVQKRTFVLCNCLYNYGFLPIPLCLMLFGTQTLGVLFVYNVGTVIGMWTVAVTALSKDAVKESFHQLYSPSMIGVYTALILNYVPGIEHLPECVETSLTWLNQSMVPLSLILVGGIMYDEFSTRDSEFTLWQSVKLINSTILVRLILVPILFVLGAKFLVSNLDLQRILIVQAAMPSAIMCLVWSRQFNGSPSTALRCVIVTNALAIVTTLVWIPIGLMIVCN